MEMAQSRAAHRHLSDFIFAPSFCFLCFIGEPESKRSIPSLSLGHTHYHTLSLPVRPHLKLTFCLVSCLVVSLWIGALFEIQMHRSGNDFTYIHNLKKGKHAFKFIVDDEWRYAPDQPTVADIEGRINNFIDVSDFEAYTGDDDYLTRREAPGTAPEEFTKTRPDLEEYIKEPPPLPPHLRHIILNKVRTKPVCLPFCTQGCARVLQRLGDAWPPPACIAVMDYP